MGKSFEEVWAEMTGRQHDAFKMKVWAALGGRETGEEGMKRLMSGEARLVMEDVVIQKKAVVVATFQSLLDACHQDGHCHSDFTESRWPLGPNAADETDWEVVEQYLTKTGILEDGMRQLEKLAVKGEIRLLTGSRRAMEYIAAHPEAQLNHPTIILPLRAQDSRGRWCLPVFCRNWDGRRRDLDLYYTVGTFRSDYSWLVLKRKQK